jgi:microcystin-dependent protein
MVIVCFAVNTSNAQAPQAIPYQAAARNSNGVIITNKTIGLRFSVRDSTATGPVVYRETQSATTNMLGMFLLNIGQGIVLSGSFSGINWGSGPKFMQVEMDTTATGNNYVDMGTQQMLSVPYALSSGNGVPIGTIVAFMGWTPPPGWLLCNGAPVSRTTYAELFKVILTSSGAGDGSNTFNLPDLRGKFLRGVDYDAGFDPDAGSRVALYPGGATGSNLGSYQSDAIQTHRHTEGSNTPSNSGTSMHGTYRSATGTVVYGASHAVNFPSLTSTPLMQDGVPAPRVSQETRPKNILVNYIIKF